MYGSYTCMYSHASTETAKNMFRSKTWWIQFCIRSFTGVLALRIPMQRRRLVAYLGISTSKQQLQQQQRQFISVITRIYQHSAEDYTTRNFRSSISYESQRCSWISSSSSSSSALTMSAADNDNVNSNDGPQQRTTARDTIAPTNDIDDSTIQQWEELYRGGSSSNVDVLSSDQINRKINTPSYGIRVVSFDLDNTLWNTSATIDAANDALAQHINEHITQVFHVTTTNAVTRVEKVMGKLYTANKIKYSPVEGESAKSPVLLTQLRKDAIHQVVRNYIEQSSNKTTDDSTTINSFVDDAFQVWMKARHDSISQYLSSSTTYVLEYIQTLAAAGGSNPKVLIGAITDGNSNPKLIPELSDIFDFYVNAEMVGIGKPNKRIYIHAVKQVFREYPKLFQDLIVTSNDEVTDDQIEELIGPWWVHIGDDFVKDIVASNSLKMRNIWTRELLPPGKVNAPLVIQQQLSDQQQPPQRTVDALMQVVSETNIVEMSIGADTYLADSISGEFATAVVEELRDVVTILQEWQSTALLSSMKSSGFSEICPNRSQLAHDEMMNKQSQVHIRKESRIVDVKFCIECGTKLPIVAKFCSTCGAVQ